MNSAVFLLVCPPPIPEWLPLAVPPPAASPAAALATAVFAAAGHLDGACIHRGARRHRDRHFGADHAAGSYDRQLIAAGGHVIHHESPPVARVGSKSRALDPNGYPSGS